MKLKIFFAFLAMVLCAIAQGVTDKVAPDGDAPVGCDPSADSKFEIAIVPIKTLAKKDLAIETRDICTSSSGNLVLALADGVLTDAQNRTGYIASNYQFQFDAPPQAGALYTAGFSACANGSLALGSSAVFWQCASGTFYNLYDRWWAAQCEAVLMVVMPCRGKAGVSQPSMSQTVVGSEVVTTTMVIPLSDGQPQVVTTTSVVYICQIGDGQIQAHTTPCIAAPTGHPVTQISDGQIQVTTGIPATQISDGQVQVTPGPVSQLSDGQVIQGTAGAPPASQLSDGQVVQGSVPSGSQQTVATATVTPTANEGGPFAVPTEAPPVSGVAAAIYDGGFHGCVAAVVVIAVAGVGGLGWF